MPEICQQELIDCFIGSSWVSSWSGMKNMRTKAIRQRRAIAVLIAGLSTCPAIVRAATFTWDGSTTTGYGYLSEHDNWAGNVAPPTSGADLVFGSVNTHGYAPTLSQLYSINSLTFNSSALSYSIAAGTLTFGGGGLTDSASNAETIGSGVVFGASQGTWQFNGNMTFTNNVNMSSYGVNMYNTGTGVVTFAGGVSGTTSSEMADFDQAGVVFSGNVTSSFGFLLEYGGPVSITAGTVKLTNTASPINMANGGTLNISNGATLDTSADGSIQNGEIFDGNAAVTVTGTNSKLVGGSNFYVGYNASASLTVTLAGKVSTMQDLWVGYNNGSSGTLTVDSGGSVTTPYLVVAPFNGSTGNVTVTGSGSNLNVTGTLYVSDGGNGTVTVSSGATVTSSYTNFVSPCTLNVSGGTFTTAALNSATFLANVGTILLTDSNTSYALNINGNANSNNTYTGTISGTGSIEKSGISTQVLSGVNTFTGLVIVTGGTLELTNGTAGDYEAEGGTIQLDFGQFGDSVVDAITGGTIIYNTNRIFGGILAANGGTQNISTVSLFSGTTIENGVSLTPANNADMFAVTNAGVINNPAGLQFFFVNSANAGGTLNISGSTVTAAPTSSGVIQINAGGSLSNQGADMLLLGGSRTYVGSSNAPGGTIVLQATNIQLNGGLLANYGTISGGTVYVNYAGLATGTGSYSSVVVNPGGAYLPGNYGIGSPAANLGSPFAVIEPATSGSTIASSPVTVTTGTMITVNPGDTLDLAGGLNAAGQAVAKLGGGTLIVAPFSAADLNISGGTLALAVPVSVLTVSTLEIGSAATLNIAHDSADIGASSLSAVTALAHLGYANGAWNGIGGITSSTAASDSKHLTAVGVIQNNQSGTAIFSTSHPFEGVVPGPGDILVACTYYGDANLDGKVDGSDYSLIDAGYSRHLTGWYNGDFNYDGVVDGSDYTLIDNAFNLQGSPLPASVPVPAARPADSWAASVPEPATVGLLIAGTLGAFGHRSGRHKRGRA
jgi:fibronectin-binding autotransporter adhesin